MSKSEISVDEYVQSLKHSGLPTVITEGLDDYTVFRRVEERFADAGVSLMPVGGKDKVLQIFRRRNEFRQIRSAFIVDKDIWLFGGVPPEYIEPTLISTDGYSIENDLYRDGEMELLLLAQERDKFLKDLDEIIRWFSFAVDKKLRGEEIEIDCHPSQILDGDGSIRPDFAAECGYSNPSELYETIRADYARQLRGKTLLSLLVKYVSHSSRSAKHSRKSLMETASIRGRPHMNRFYNELRNIFSG
jgi:hypothetical protein